MMAATLSSSLLGILLQLVPNREHLDKAISEAILEIQRYAELSPSLGLAAKTILDVDSRRQALLSEPC